jgi:hypothetical protein
MKNLFKIIAVLFILSLSGLVGKVAAQNSLAYPIADLGNCRDARECYLYCQIPQNKAACWSYAKHKAPPNVLGVTTMSEVEKQQMEAKAKQYNIVFPIAELNNCAGPQQCRDFCEQPNNYETCMNFAKKKGFANKIEQPPDDGIPEEKRQFVMQSAQAELGCTSMESCRAICEQNRGKCEAFAKKHGLHKEDPQERGRKEEIMKKAREDLRCESMESCKTICEKNPQRCMEFAKKHGFDRGEGQYRQEGQRERYENGPSVRPPCAGEESCKKYCQEHPDECPGYQGKPEFTPAGGELRSSAGGSYDTPSAGFVGPTGCRTEEECKAYCQTNPDKCPGFKKAEEKLRTYPSYAPINMPQTYPSYAPQPPYYPQPTP